jgi:rhodanese-related sulfurtransferase
MRLTSPGSTISKVDNELQYQEPRRRRILRAGNLEKGIDMKHPPEFLALVAEAKTRIREVAPAEAAALIEAGAAVVDVREKDEFAGPHIEGAVNISRGVLEMRVGEVVPDKSAPVVCYCGGGNRGALATDTLRKMGYRNVVSIAGGLTAYLAGKKKS